MIDRIHIALKVNDQVFDVCVEPRFTLADVLRTECGLTGTHVGCEHGVCGSCTVIVDGAPVRSCLMFAVQAEGSDILTVEGLAPEGQLHPVQRALSEHHGLQCGFCTPGFILLMVAALRENASPTDEEIVHLLSSNLCRCTGYQNIVKAMKSLVSKA